MSHTFPSWHHRLQILNSALPRMVLALALLGYAAFSPAAFAQSASIDFRAERGYVFENSVNGLLTFAALINNPTASPLTNVQLVISMPATVNLGNVDRECLETAISGTRRLTCTVPSVPTRGSKILDFFVDGPNSKAAGASFTVAITSSSVPVLEPDAFTASLADGDASVSGSSLTIQLVRDIDIDIDRNGVPDIDEAIMNLPKTTELLQLQTRKAVVDILFLYTPAAEQYLDGKLHSRIAQILTATNQTFRENNIAMRFNGTGLASVPYATTNVTLSTLLSSIRANAIPEFDSLDQLVTSSGGDIVVILHALDTGADSFCGFGALVGAGRQGDFRTAHHQGELLSILNVGPDCPGLMDISPLLATNMGIVATRQDFPDGGTFSYSAGYAITDLFRTVAAQLGSNNFGQAEPLNRFSSPQQLCKSVACGVDRSDIANGADAAYSLNKTRHLVSAITPSRFPIEPEALPERITISPSLNHDLEIRQTASDTAALYGEFTEIQVSITNVSGEKLENLNVAFEHLNGGLVSNEAQNYQITHNTCGVLGAGLNTVGQMVGGALQKLGRQTCFIEALEPGEALSFSYRIQIDNTPPQLNGNGYYHEMVTVNGMPQPESAVCLPVFANFILANTGSTVCDSVLAGVAPTPPVDLNALPSVTGSMLSLPFLRLWDGSLISAEIRITLNGPLAFEFVSYTDLDSGLTPVYEANYDLAGVLLINNLQVGRDLYDISGTYVTDSNPIRFENILATFISAVPGP